MTRHPDHDAAAIFPLMSGRDLASLTEDIGGRGLLKPIWIAADGRILDGRARYRACQLADVVPAFRIWQGAWCGDPESAVEFVLRQNLHLRQLDPARLCLVGARIYQLPDAMRADLPDGVRIAARLRLSQTSLYRAIHILMHGTPDLIAAVAQGRLQLPSGKQIARLPPADQADAIAQALRPRRRTGRPLRAPVTPLAGAPVLPTGKSPDAVAARQAARRQQLQQMADDGFNSDQIAAALGISRERVQQLLHQAGIICYGDRVRSRFKADANRILGHMVATAEDLVADEALVNFSQLDPAQLPAWIASLASAHKSLGALINRLRQQRKETSHNDHTFEIHTPSIEDPPRADRSADRAPGFHHAAPVYSVARQSPGERSGSK